MKLDIPYYLELQRRYKEILLFVSCHSNNFNCYSIKIENLFVDCCAFFDSLCQYTIMSLKSAEHTFSCENSISHFGEKINGEKYFNMGDYKTLLNSDFELSSKELNLNLYEESYYDTPLRALPKDMNGFRLKPFENWSSCALCWWKSFTKLKRIRPTKYIFQ